MSETLFSVTGWRIPLYWQGSGHHVPVAARAPPPISISSHFKHQSQLPYCNPIATTDLLRAAAGHDRDVTTHDGNTAAAAAAAAAAPTHATSSVVVV